MDYDGAKRLKSSSGAPISIGRPVAGASPTASLPQYQPPGHRNSPIAQPSVASLSRAQQPGGTQSLKLTVKATPSKLRQATSGSQLSPIPPNPYAANDPSESDATPQPAVRTARSTRNPRTVVEPESDEDEDMDAEGEEDDDAEGEDVDQELLGDEDSEGDAEGSDDDTMEEIQASHPPPPVIRQEKPPGKSKLNVTVTAPTEGPLKSVEDKEMEDAEDDELSELDSGDENDVAEDDEEENADEDDESGSDIDGSRSATPDLSKLTRRQRGAYSEDANLMALSNEAQKKKHLSAEEHAMRRQEMARRRKNLSEKRNEEEKMDTINKLLKKPAPKRRTRAEILAAQAAEATPGAEDEDYVRKADPLYTRWTSHKDGCTLAVPEEWLEGPLGEIFRKSGEGKAPVMRTSGEGGRMIEEVA